MAWRQRSGVEACRVTRPHWIRATTNQEEQAMPGFAFVAPILPGKEQLDAETFEQFAVGDEHDAYAAAQSHYRTRRDRCGRAGGGSCGDRSAATQLASASDDSVTPS